MQAMFARAEGPTSGRYIDGRTGELYPGRGRARVLVCSGDHIQETGRVVEVAHLSEETLEDGTYLLLSEDASSRGTYSIQLAYT